jgi:hypothetical protein
MKLWLSTKHKLSGVVPEHDIVLALQLTKRDSKGDYSAAKNLLTMNKLCEAAAVLLSSVAKSENWSVHWSNSAKSFFYVRIHPSFGNKQKGMAQQQVGSGSSWRFKAGDDVEWRS